MGSSSGKVAATGATGTERAAEIAVELVSVTVPGERFSCTCAVGGCASPRYLEIDSPGSNIGWYPAGGPNCWDLPDSWARGAGGAGTLSIGGRAKRGSGLRSRPSF